MTYFNEFDQFAAQWLRNLYQAAVFVMAFMESIN